MKIAIADDHTLVREGLVAVLSQMKGVTEVFQAATLDELNKLLDFHRTMGLVLLDLDMPGMNDVTSFEELQDRHPKTAIAILSATEIGSVAKRFLDAGAAGYIPKSANKNMLFRAVQLILSGNTYVPNFAVKPAIALCGRTLSLTDRQYEVLALMAKGFSNKDIADSLSLSESTVKTHSSSIIKAFGVKNRTKVISEALRLGIVESQ